MEKDPVSKLTFLFRIVNDVQSPETQQGEQLDNLVRESNCCLLSASTKNTAHDIYIIPINL